MSGKDEMAGENRINRSKSSIKKRAADQIPADWNNGERTGNMARDGQNRRRTSRKDRQMKAAIVGIAGAVIGISVLLGIFVGIPAYKQHKEMVAFYQDHFLPNTTINGIDISNRTPEGAATYLKETLENYHLAIITREGDTLELTGDDINLTSDIKVDFNALLEEQDPGRWRRGAKEPNEVPIFFNYDRDLLQNWYNQNGYFSRPGRLENAKMFVDYADGQYVFHEQVQGTRIDDEKMLAALRMAVAVLKTELVLNETNGYIDPLMPDPDPALVSKIRANVKEMDEHLAATISYYLGDGIWEVVDADILSGCYKLDENYDIVFSDTPLQKFVQRMKKKYDTYGIDRYFAAHDGQTRLLEGGTYGWIMNYYSSTDQLVNMVKAKQKVEATDFVWNQTAASHVNGRDYGDTYIECDLDSQHGYVWWDGALVLDMDFVSGDATHPNYYTWEGCYYVADMERDHIMRGERDENGVPEYERPCKYWMNFIPEVGIGLHDLARIWYGGDIYLRNGSHGCINLRETDAQTIYEKYCYIGLPVITYGGQKNIPPETSEGESEGQSTEASSEETSHEPTTAAQIIE